jgi:hypothetical protein
VIRLGLGFGIDMLKLSASCMCSDTLYFCSSYSIKEMEGAPLCWLTSFTFELSHMNLGHENTSI